MYKKKKTEQEAIPDEQAGLNEEGSVETAEAPETEGTPSDGMEQLKAEAEQYKDNYLRATAEFQNYKRRSEKEKADIYKYAGEKLLVDLLPIVDNIERAMSHVADEEQNGLADGVRMIYKSLQGLLEKNGVEAIAAVGEAFDPEVHHAVQMVASDEHEPQHVIEEYQKGYRLNGKVIRFSMVKVSE